VVSSDQVPGTQWLDIRDKNHAFSNQLHSRFAMNDQSSDRIVSKFKTAGHTFISTKNGRVFDVLDDSQNFVSLGRQRLLASGADSEGKSVFTLHQDGAIWRFSLNGESKGIWSRMKYSGIGFSKLNVSPDGTRIVLLGSANNSARVIASETGETIAEYSAVAAVVWDPSVDHVLGLAYVDGKIELLDGIGANPLTNVVMAASESIKSISFFNETWTNRQTPADRYLMVQTETELKGTLHFVPLIPSVDGTLPTPKDIEVGLTLLASPRDSVLVTGGKTGAVNVWFASPKWNTIEQLFGLDGHLGSPIEFLAFSMDGTTLITSDANNRLYGWLSVDTISNLRQ